MATRPNPSNLAPAGRRARTLPGGAWLLLLAGGIAGCNALFGIDEGSYEGPDGGAGAADAGS
ncbi:MAG TPA: hypothetical protein VFS00_01825, partial [Polyangiaceae bacterium]|nr:hypothetical protein [Polyangiaceae bacterium]